MDILIDIILPIFGTVFMAYFAVRFRLFPEQAIDGLSKFVFNFAIPPMLFHTMSRQILPDPIEWAFLFSFFGAGYVVWILGILVSLWWFRRDFAHASCAVRPRAIQSTRRLMTRYRRARMLRIYGPMRLTSGLCATTDAAQGRKRLTKRHNRATRFSET